MMSEKNLKSNGAIKNSVVAGIFTSLTVGILGILAWFLVDYLYSFLTFFAGAAIGITACMGFSMGCKDSRWKYLVASVVSVVYTAAAIYLSLVVTYFVLADSSGSVAGFGSAFEYAGYCLRDRDAFMSLLTSFLLGLLFAGIALVVMYLRERAKKANGGREGE